MTKGKIIKTLKAVLDDDCLWTDAEKREMIQEAIEGLEKMPLEKLFHFTFDTLDNLADETSDFEWTYNAEHALLHIETELGEMTGIERTPTMIGK